jgi:hypothetical protein
MTFSERLAMTSFWVAAHPAFYGCTNCYLHLPNNCVISCRFKREHSRLKQVIRHPDFERFHIERFHEVSLLSESALRRWRATPGLKPLPLVSNSPLSEYRCA